MSISGRTFAKHIRLGGRSTAIVLAAVISMLAVRPLAHELTGAEQLFGFTAMGQFVETESLRIDIKSIYLNEEDFYNIHIFSKHAKKFYERNFFENPGGTPLMTRLIDGYACGTPIILMEFEQGVNPNADIVGYLYETHAFRADTLEYIDTAYAPFSDIAPVPDGTDIGFPYEIPQRIGLRCGTDPGGPPFTFYERHP